LVCAEALDSLNDVLSSHNFAAIGKPPRLQRVVLANVARGDDPRARLSRWKKPDSLLRRKPESKGIRRLGAGVRRYDGFFDAPLY